MSERLKVVLLGHSGVGKSSLVLRFVKDQFTDGLASTIGAAYLEKELSIDASVGSSSTVAAPHRVQVQIWDTAGQEQYRSIAPLYYRGAMGAIVVYDVTNPDSLSVAQYWIDELRTKGEDQVVIALVGNKADAPKSEHLVTEEMISKFKKAFPVPIHLLCSAKSGLNVNKLFQDLGTECLRIMLVRGSIRSESVAIDDVINTLGKKKSDSCCG